MAQPPAPLRRSYPQANITHDRIQLEDDYEIVQARTSSVRAQGFSIDTARTATEMPTWNVGRHWAPLDDPQFSLDFDDSQYEDAMGAEIGDIMDGVEVQMELEAAKAVPRKKKRRSEASARPHVYWKKNHREQYLREFLRWEGRGEFMHATECPDCIARRREAPQSASYRCVDCFVPDLTCKDCCVRRHQLNPLHIVEEWTGSTFVKVSLEEMGLVIHLNHSGLRCPLPAPVDQRFRILHTNGFHKVAFSYCGCTREIPQHLQLLRRGFYPASQQNVRTAFTFSLLRLVHSLALASKVSTFDVYRALERLSANSNVAPPKPRYRPLMRVLAQWRHLKLLKRGGRGHDPSGAAGTRNGELAIACPSCPIPDVNLEEGWMDADEESSYLFQDDFSMDANFRLKNALVSNYSTDPGLGIGWAYLLPREDYEEYVLSQADQEDISTCVGFQALAKATTRNSKGLRYTGVGMVSCARSEMVMPNGVGNLQKGERYANMDFIFAFVVSTTYVLRIAISYDIACQWFINLFVRMRAWPGHLRLRPGLFLRPLIPKFHEPAHIDKDHDQYSFNLAEGVGLTDGEAPERIWASHNALAHSTKSMGPGTMHDVYNDNFGYWNWMKYTGMGVTLLRKFKAAVVDRNKQAEAHRGFTNSLPKELIAKWEEMCTTWDGDSFPKSVPSPFFTAGADITEDDAATELDAEEARSRETSGRPALHRTSAVSFLVQGLALEEEQRRIRALATEQAQVPLNLRDSTLKDQRAILRRKIQDWELLRAIYMPGLLQFLTDQGESPINMWEYTNPDPETVDLWLPSRITSECRRMVCVENLPSQELKLRTAQCAASLEAIRHVLRVKTRMVYFKNKNIKGQRDGTRSRSVIDRVHNRACRLALKYRAAREARLSLEGPGIWERTYRELRNEDIRSYTSGAKKKGVGRRGIWEDGQAPPAPDNEEAPAMSSDESDIDVDAGVPLTRAQMLKARKKGTGETRKEMSWIWLTSTTIIENPDSDSDQANDILRSEWARSRARSRRAHEEVELVAEEMRRVLKTLDWCAGRWDVRESQASQMHVSDDIREGLVSYAKDQAGVQRSLRASFQLLWKTPLSRVDRVVTNDIQPDEVNESAEIEEGEGIEGGDEGEDSDSDGEDVMDTDSGGVDTPHTAGYPFRESVHSSSGSVSDGDNRSSGGGNDEGDGDSDGENGGSSDDNRSSSGNGKTNNNSADRDDDNVDYIDEDEGHDSD